MSRLSKIEGALIGGAIGDAVGFLVEKRVIKTVHSFVHEFEKEQFLIKNRTHPQRYEFGQYSDDTQFSRLLAESILDNKNFLDLLVDNYKSNKLIGLGKNTRKLLELYSRDGSVPFSMTKNISNGGVMRSWIIGLLFSCPVSMKVQSSLHSSLTHNTQESIDCCELLARTMSFALNNDKVTEDDILGFTPEKLKPILIEVLAMDNSEDIRNRLIFPTLEDWEGIPPLAIPTTIASLVSYIKTNEMDFKSSIAYGLSLGGDTDSVCSIIGALKGVKGLDTINPFLRNIIHDQGDYKEDYFFDLAKKINNFKE